MKKIAKNSKYRFPVVFSFLYSLATVIGHNMYRTNRLNLSLLSLTTFFILFASLSFVFFYLFSFLSGCRFMNKPERALSGFFSGKNSVLLIWAVIFICWIPCFVAYYPGIFAYDMLSQTTQATGNGLFSTAHPPLHTYIWKLCLILGGKTGFEAVSIYAVISMLFFSFCLAYVTKYIAVQTGSNFWSILSVLYFSLNPVLAIMSINPTKDVFFAVFLALYTTEIHKFGTDSLAFLSSKKDIFLLCLFSLMCLLFRNNAICVIAIVAIALPVKIKSVKAGPVLCIPIVLFLIIYNFVFGALGIVHGSTREALNLPMMQVASVIVNDGDSLSETEKEETDYFMPRDLVVENYNPRLADNIKFNAFKYIETAQDTARFLRLWMHLMPKHLKEYTDEFLALNLPYWYPFADSVDEFSGRYYIETDIYYSDYYHFERNVRFPLLYSFYQVMAYHTLIDKIPVVSLVFSIATPIWLLLFCSFFSKFKGNRRSHWVLLPSFILWITYLFGAVSNFRYVFPIICLYPLFLSLSFTEEKNE